MSAQIVQWPFVDWAIPARVEWALDDQVLQNRSALSGAVQTASVAFERWVVNLKFSANRNADQQKLFGLMNRIGPSNRVEFWHHELRAPRGTLRGLPTLAIQADQFAQQFTINAPDGATLLTGDLIGVGGQVFVVVADAVSVGGVMVVSVRGRVRTTQTAGTAVTWDRPTARFIRASASALVPFQPRASEGFAVQFIEDFR